jgi:hypothetical protein
MLTATCHCGAVRVTVPRKPRTVTDCSCSICRRYGALFARHKAVRMARGRSSRYYGDSALNEPLCGSSFGCGLPLLPGRSAP